MCNRILKDATDLVFKLYWKMKCLIVKAMLILARQGVLKGSFYLFYRGIRSGSFSLMLQISFWGNKKTVFLPLRWLVDMEIAERDLLVDLTARFKNIFQRLISHYPGGGSSDEFLNVVVCLISIYKYSWKVQEISGRQDQGRVGSLTSEHFTGTEERHSLSSGGFQVEEDEEFYY